MSHSSFKIIANDEPINRNLVIIVNKNGDVNTDTTALQTLLTSKETPKTGVTVIRETSPTLSISDEIEEERQERNEMLRQQYILDHPNANEEEIEQQMNKIATLNDIPHVTLNVENFYTPDQARKFANDVLHLGGIDNPQTLVPIDYNFRRQIIQNDHCYTPLTMSPEPQEKHANKGKIASQPKGGVSKKENKAAQKARQAQALKEESSSDEDAVGEDDEDLEEEQSAEEEEISFSESDDDNDMDFSVNDRFGKKGKKKRKYRKHKQKSMTFKDFLEGGDPSSMDEEPKKKYGKVPKKAAKAALDTRPTTSGKNIGQPSAKNTQQSIAIRKIQQQSQAKSTPVRKEPPTQANVSISKPSTTATTSAISHISIQSAAPAKSSQEIEFVESMVKDLEKSFPDNSSKKAQVATTAANATIPNIMQMMETNTPTEVIDQSLSTLEQLDANDGAVGIDEIGDALIAVLGNDAIDELLNQGDLMNFDASAATSIKSAQNVVSSTTALGSPSTSQQSSSADVSPSTPSTQLPKILNKEALTKDGIKVVRNGRVITLPPIEAPATRGAKRRAQGDPIPLTPSPVNKIIKTEKAPSIKDTDSRNSSRRSSLNKSESGKGSRRQSTTQGGNPDEENDIDSDASWNSEDDPDRLWCICKQPHNNRFMICCDKCEEWFHGTCVNVTKNMGKKMEKQDIKWHCPNCKSNVGAVKKDPNKKTLNQQKLTKFFSKHQKESTDEDIPKQTGSRLCVVCHQKPARPDSIYCSEDCICNHATKHIDDTPSPKTPTTSNSGKTLDTLPPGKANVLKDKKGSVIVFNRVTGKLLSSKLWPHFTNLSQWMSQNPNCEPVKPGTPQAKQLQENMNNSKKIAMQQQQQQQQQHQSPTTPNTVSSTSHSSKKIQGILGDDLFSNPVKINTGAKDSPVPSKKSSQGQHAANSGTIHSNSSMKNSTSAGHTKTSVNKMSSVSSTSSATPSKVATPKSIEVKKIKRQVLDEKSPPAVASAGYNSNKAKVELERKNVRLNFKTTLQHRMSEFEHPTIPKMTEEEIDKFASDVESEMFIFNNKDTREKYKIKFRSLKFNLSDTKNKTLLEKICAKKLSPKQLVQLPPAALASEELAKWREDENKHQLEIITKSELDALAQNKIVLKTHKGEEILETKTDPSSIALPDENDVESMIKGTVLSVDDPLGKYDRSASLNASGGGRDHSVNSPLSSPSISSSTGRKSDSHHSRSRSKSRGRDHHHHHKSSSSSKHKKSERHRSRSPRHHHHSSSSSSHHHSRDKSRGERSRDKSRDKSHEREERDRSKKRSDDHKHHRDKSKSNENDKTSSKSKDHHSSSSSSKESSKDSKRHHHHHHHHHHQQQQQQQQHTPEQPKEAAKVEKVEIKPGQEDVDIVGKILDSMGVHLEPKPRQEGDEERTPENESVKSEQTPLSHGIEPTAAPISTEPINEHQLEIEIYSGNMYMADVTKFDVTASIVSGNVDDIIKLFTPQMEIVGRIEPKTVWDYLGKVKKLPGKELTVLRFSSTDQNAYFTLFSYLHSRQRYGVIKSPSSIIKDFYLITVEASRPLPPVLLPIVGPGFVEGEEHKPDLLLGVILKVQPESKHQMKKTVSSVKKSSKSSKPAVEHIVPIQILPLKHKSHHSHGSKLTMGLPDVENDDSKVSPKKSFSKDGDDDEPYTPFDDEDDSLPETPVFSTQPVASSSKKHNVSDDLESEMEKLEREIQQRQNEIQTLAKQKALELNEEQASKIFEKISVPHNLSEILSTIKASEPKPMEIDDDDDDDEYIPMSTTANSIEYRASSSYASNITQQQQPPIVNSMMDIDERINLFRQEMPGMNNHPISSTSEQPSRLASMSDADLMKLVPDDAFEAPPPPIISNEPAIPGLEYDEMEH